MLTVSSSCVFCHIPVVIVILKANTHSRITWAMLYGRVVRPCNTGEIHLILPTRVTPVLHGRVVWLSRSCVYQEPCSQNFLLKIFKKAWHVMLFCQYGYNTVAIWAAYRCVFWRRTTWAVLIISSTCRQRIAVARYLRVMCSYSQAVTHGHKWLSSFSM